MLNDKNSLFGFGHRDPDNSHKHLLRETKKPAPLPTKYRNKRLAPSVPLGLN